MDLKNKNIINEVTEQEKHLVLAVKSIIDIDKNWIIKSLRKIGYSVNNDISKSVLLSYVLNIIPKSIEFTQEMINRMKWHTSQHKTSIFSNFDFTSLFGGGGGGEFDVLGSLATSWQNVSANRNERLEQIARAKERKQTIIVVSVISGVVVIMIVVAFIMLARRKRRNKS